jgi:hypothetical protein
VTDRGLNDMRCFRGGLTLGVHKIPFLEFSPCITFESLPTLNTCTCLAGRSTTLPLTIILAESLVAVWTSLVFAPCKGQKTLSAQKVVTSRGRSDPESSAPADINRSDVCSNQRIPKLYAGRRFIALSGERSRHISVARA